MKKILYILVIAGLSGNLTACQKALRAEQQGVQLDIVTEVVTAPETKGAFFPDGSGYMPNFSSFGLFVCDHHTGSYTDGSNPYTEYAVRFNNIRAYRYNSWQYNYSGYSGFSTLYLGPKDEDLNGITDNTCDIFAYAPHQDGVTRLESIPFDISNAVDVLYVEQNAHPTINKNINPADYIPSPGHLAVPLTFHHALSLLEFDFRLKNHDYEHPMDPAGTLSHRLQSIRIDRLGGHLYSSGTMNAMTGGELSNLTAANSITVTWLTPNGSGSAYVDVSPDSNPARAYVLQVPTRPGEDYQDGDYLFTFTFSGMVFPVTFTLLREHLRHGTSSTYGFQPGYKYTFKFEIDNYVHFEGVTVGEWETVTTPAMQTEI